MINFDFDEHCCGCTACASSCAKRAIVMHPNEEGFLMPHINEELCVECGRCEKCCPHLNTTTDRSQYSLESFKGKSAFLYYTPSEERKDSASGGYVFTAMKHIVQQGGVACGCVWDENLKAIHIVSDKEEDLKRMQNSKYVQSDMKNCFEEIRTTLRQGRQVVFCGTPCQTAGLRQFLGKSDTSLLISICLICHGVPSPLVWEKWKGIVEKKYNGKLLNVKMRDKSYRGYTTSYVRYTLADSRCGECGSESDPHTSPKAPRNVGLPTYLADPYLFLFTDDLFLRHSCNHCQYKADNNGADIVVGDYYACTEGDNNMGCSSLITMTEKGEVFTKSLEGVLKETDYTTVGTVNSMLWESVPEHPKRKAFFNELHTETSNSEKLFLKYLPFRFHVKKVLNDIGVFDIARKVYTAIYK